MKKIVCVLLAIVLGHTSIAPVAGSANDNITVIVHGVQVDFEGQPPIIVNGRTLVPIRGVFEVLGFELTWKPELRQAVMIRTNDEIIITIDSTIFTHNDTIHSLDVAAQIVGGRTMVPLRAVLERVGYELDWDNLTSTVIINTPTTISNSFAHLPIAHGIPSMYVTQEWLDAWPGLTDVEQYVFRFINEYRAQYELHPLEICPILSALAWYRISYLIYNGYRRRDGGRESEQGSVHAWGSHRSRYIARLVRYFDSGKRDSGLIFAGRSLRRGHISAYMEARDLVNSWINSTGHRNIMISESALYIGVAATLSNDGSWVYSYAFTGVNR